MGGALRSTFFIEISNLLLWHGVINCVTASFSIFMQDNELRVEATIPISNLYLTCHYNVLYLELNLCCLADVRVS